ncbi:hypothetical protein BVC71_02885 [Marivivens niveibacter]|uniref:Glycosyltransferase 2-like domain-containing protein n=1 Tax=Marivivens niveibacter TaxID=1930667 RepID=A0A251X147_9RHOB|nr:glycosyltransferase [Marivivens niveibacter]OUD10460.1 hypothetical protein BVC71_02885 [Marivivens niveibacter]
MTRFTRITIAAATFRRPSGLSRLLDHIEALETAAVVTVLICDNDGQEQAGKKIVEARLAKGYRFKLECISEPKQGLSYARNALFEHIATKENCDYIAMIDDDEWPSRQWLTKLEETAFQTKADVVGGPVQSVFENETPPCVVHCEQFRRKRNQTGPVPVVLSTENALLKFSILGTIPKPWFDPVFATTGGEDADFFYRAKRSGATFAWADDAEILEAIPASRSTAQWALKRNFRRGSTTAWRATQRPEKLKSITRLVLFGLVGICSFPAFWFLGCRSPVRRLDARLRLWRSIGYFSGFARYRVHEYKVDGV